MSQEHILFSLSFSFPTSSSGKVIARTCKGGGSSPLVFLRLFCLAFGQGFFLFFCTFFLKVPPHPVVKVHPIFLPLLIVLAVNTGCLCIFPAHYQQTALIMQIRPSLCALHSIQTIDQAIKHNQSGRGAEREERVGLAVGPVSREQSIWGRRIKKLLKSVFPAL